VPYDPNVDYSLLIEEARKRGDLAAAALYEQQRNSKIAGMGLDYDMSSDYVDSLNAYDATTNYKKLIEDAAKAGDYHLAAVYESLRNAQIEGEGLKKLTGVSKSYKYQDYLYGATNSKSSGNGTGGGGDDPDSPTPTTTYYTKKYWDNEAGKVSKTEKVTLDDIAAEAAAYAKAHANQDANSRTLANWLSENGYTGDAATEFKGFIQQYAEEAKKSQ